MSNKKIITIVSIIVTILVIATATVLIINKNIKTTKTSVSGNNMGDEVDLETEEPTDEATDGLKSGTPSPKTSPSPKVPVGKYYIKVNNQMNTVTVYVKDENGNYTIPVKAMICSTGKSTPKNTKHTLKYRWTWLKMIGGVYAQYVTQINGDVCFHSVPYFKQNKATLEYLLYDKLGTTCSAGCIRLKAIDAKWIYDNCASGTTVEFYSSSNPGPLGKPSAMKISSSGVPLRNWDPTDPDPNNPWKNVPVEVPSTEPSVAPSETPEVETPSIEPTETSTIEPTNTPTVTATVTPSASPSREPSEEPSEEPTVEETPITEPTQVQPT